MTDPKPPTAVHPVFLHNRLVGIFTDYELAVKAVRERYGTPNEALRGVVISTFPVNQIDDEGVKPLDDDDRVFR